MTKRYTAFRVETEPFIEVKDDAKPGQARPLVPRLDLFPAHPCLFSWGAFGGPDYTLAVALLADALGDDRRALRVYQQFARGWLTVQPWIGWTVTDEEICRVVYTLEAFIRGERRAAAEEDSAAQKGEEP